MMHEPQDVRLQPQTLVADHQHRSPLEWKRVQTLRAGRLLERDKLVSFVAPSRQRGGKRAMDFDRQTGRVLGGQAIGAILPMTLALPQQINVRTPQQAAARTIRDRLTLLRMGGQATTSSRSRTSGAGGLWRSCSYMSGRLTVERRLEAGGGRK